MLAGLRCDFSDLIQDAIKGIAIGGTGVFLYLMQDSHGIVLINKLRAFELQDRGFDTIDANEQLGLDTDERIYLPATQILQQLGYRRICLMTNIPEKAFVLVRYRFIVDERVPHSFPSNRHNETSLRTKAVRGGHLI